MNTENKVQRLAIVRHIPFIVISLLGFGGILVVKTVFDQAMRDKMLSDGVMPIAYDNFYLYFELSLIMCAVLLGLTFLSSLTYVLQKGVKSKFTKITVTASPVICAIAMLMISAFYAYLTYDSETPIVSYLILLGVCEAALFLFPVTLTKIASVTEPDKSPRKSNKRK